MARSFLSALAYFRLDKNNPVCQQIFFTHVELPFTPKPIYGEEKTGRNKFASYSTHVALLCLLESLFAPCSIDFVETATFDPGVTVSSPVFLVSFAVEVKGVEGAVASSVAVDVTVVSSGGFVITVEDCEECDVDDDVAAITVDDVAVVVTEDVTGVAVVTDDVDDVGAIGTDDVVNDAVDDVAVLLTAAVDDVDVVVVDGVDDDVATVSTGAAEDTIVVDGEGEAVGEGDALMSPGIDK